DIRTLARDYVGERDVALDRIAANAGHAYRAAADDACREEVGRRRRIALDVHATRRPIVRACGHVECRSVRRAYGYAEAFHQPYRDLDVRARNERRRQRDSRRDVLRATRER